MGAYIILEPPNFDNTKFHTFEAVLNVKAMEYYFVKIKKKKKKKKRTFINFSFYSNFVTVWGFEIGYIILCFGIIFL